MRNPSLCDWRLWRVLKQKYLKTSYLIPSKAAMVRPFASTAASGVSDVHVSIQCCSWRRGWNRSVITVLGPPTSLFKASNSDPDLHISSLAQTSRPHTLLHIPLFQVRDIKRSAPSYALSLHASREELPIDSTDRTGRSPPQHTRARI